MVTVVTKQVVRHEDGSYGKCYDNIEEFVNGFARVKEGGLFGFINEEGVEIASPKYESAWNFQNGFAVVKKDGLHGFINEKGEEITPLKYGGANDFKNGFALVKKNALYGFINEKGEEIVPPKFTGAEDFCKIGYARVFIDGKMGNVSKTGEECWED